MVHVTSNLVIPDLKKWTCVWTNRFILRLLDKCQKLLNGQGPFTYGLITSNKKILAIDLA